ncbi:TnsA-like heteromeric transposase endonuclease subunit [Streptomyces sp. NPDC002795]|uniref:TnsA-like heteromeric transposase endonuclease subunit n=1 Tax=Streptomyces sp. NPDC002795 TaxID=3364665 RepID=UPI0036C25A80
MATDVDAGRSGLNMGDGWTRRWAVSWRAGGDDASRSVHDLAQEPVLTSGPMRHFTWRRDQRHRPGLQFLTSTGQHHGAESLEESRVLLALTFAGDVVDVVSQPLKISFATCGKRRAHTPDYLTVTRRAVWLIDVRPEPLIKEADRESFAAAAEVACGWRYAVAARWRKHTFAGLDAMASQRRLRSDPLGLRPVLLAEAAGGRRFGELVAATGCEPVARAHPLYLLWSRQLGVDLAAPLQDRSLVMRSGVRSGEMLDGLVLRLA